jgi:hypothetical protein
MTKFELPFWIGPALAVAAVLSAAIWFVICRGKPIATTGFFIFVVGPFLFFGLVLASLTFAAPLVLRLVLLTAATFMPATLYFLFIAARRESLFNTFATNLDRLGLLHRRWVAGPDDRMPRRTALRLETPDLHGLRLKNYLDRFGAAYGSLDEDFVKRFLGTATADRSGEPAASGQASYGSIGGTAFDLPNIIPVLGTTCLLALGWVAALPPGLFEALPATSTPSQFLTWFASIVTPTLNPVIFAFLGAYFFSLQMIVRRFVRRDLGPNAYNAISQRILLAAIGIWVTLQAFQALGTGIDEGSAVVLVAAFAVGAFPLIVWQLVTATLKKFPPFQAALPSLNSAQPLSAIDGLTVWHQSRLEDVDVENVPNLATSDVVDLLLHTKIPTHRLVDWIDQAILITYLGPADTGEAHDGTPSMRDQLQLYGIRTATALESACRGPAAPADTGAAAAAAGLTPVAPPSVPLAPVAGEPAPPAPAPAPIPPLAGASGDRLRAIVAAMQDCPNFVLVRSWRGIADGVISGTDQRTERPDVSAPPRIAA